MHKLFTAGRTVNVFFFSLKSQNRLYVIYYIASAFATIILKITRDNEGFSVPCCRKTDHYDH
jgi:hypothetical protein